jgi:hypothetical protein
MKATGKTAAIQKRLLEHATPTTGIMTGQQSKWNKHERRA